MSYLEEILADAPVGYWRLGESEGATAADESGGDHDGTYVGGPTLGGAGALRADPDTSIAVEGDGAHVEIGHAADLAPSAALTIEAWVRPVALTQSYTATFRTIASMGPHATQNYGLYWRHDAGGASQDLIFILNDGSERLEAAASWTNHEEEWVHVVAVYDGANQILYLNGVEIGRRAFSGAITTSVRDLLFGYDGDAGSDRVWEGGLDEVAVYDTGLSPERITAHYRARLGEYGAAVLEDAPLAYWTLDEESGTTAKDEAGENDGTYGGGPALGAAGALAGDVGAAVEFDGVDDNVDTPLVGPTGTAERTWEAWVRSSAAADYYPIMEQGVHDFGQRFSFRMNGHLDAPGTLRVDVQGGFIFGTTPINDGEWHHVVAVLPAGATDVTEILLYVDGELDTIHSSSSQALDTQAGTGVEIAGPGLSGGRHFPGRIDEVAVYDTALSAARIAAHYEAATTVPNEPPARPTLTVDEARETEADLSGSAYSDPDGDAHAASQWQIDEAAGDFSAPVVDSGTDAANLTSYTATGLTAETDYQARVRYQDAEGAWSEWSAAVAFTTASGAVWQACEGAPASGWASCDPDTGSGGSGEPPDPDLADLLTEEDGALLLLEFEEESGTQALDTSGNGHHADYVGSPIFGADGIVRSGFAFRGDGNQYLEIPDASFAATAEWTVEGWFEHNPSSFSNRGTVIGYWPDGSFNFNPQWLIQPAGRDHFLFDVENVGEVFISRDDTQGVIDWRHHRFHFALTYDGTTLTLYIDGEVLYEQDVAVPVRPGGVIRIGRDLAGTDSFIGRIDHVAFFDYALSPEQIAQHIRALTLRDLALGDLKPATVVLRAYYHLAEGASPAVDDVGDADGAYQGDVEFRAERIVPAVMPSAVFTDDGGVLVPHEPWMASTDDFVIFGWVRSDDYGPFARICEFAHQFDGAPVIVGFYIQDNGLWIERRWQDGETVGDDLAGPHGTLVNGEPHFVGAAVDRVGQPGAILYLDGEIEVSSSGTSGRQASPITDEPLLIGGRCEAPLQIADLMFLTCSSISDGGRSAAELYRRQWAAEEDWAVVPTWSPDESRPATAWSAA